MLLFNLHPLFEAADKAGSGGGEDTSPPGEQQPEGDDKGAEKGKVEDEFFGETGADILKNAPVIEPGKPTDQSKKSEEPEQGAEKAGEQKSEQQTVSEKFKLDDQEYTAEQIRNWKKDADAKAEWQKRLTQESQLDNFMRSLQPEVKDAFIARAIADVYAKKDPKEYLKEGEEADLTLTFEDEDGNDIDQTISPGSEHYKALYDHFEKLFLKRYQPAFVELKSHKEQLQSFHDDQQRFYRESSQREAIGFLKKHPEIGIPVSEGMDLEKTMKEAVTAGPTHPLYNGALRFYSLGKAAAEMGMKLEDYFGLIYGDFQEKKEAAQKITETDKKNQQAGASQEPGKGFTKDMDFIDRLNQASGTGHEDLVAEFDKGKTERR